MSRAPVIAKRELSSFFYSPIAYVAMFLFLIVAGYWFSEDFKPGQPAGLRVTFESMVWVLVLILPILCMGLLAQEWASGTIETMMTAPVSESDLVVGKFLGSYFFFLVLLAPTLLFPVMLTIYSRPDFGPIATGYLGLILVGGLFIAVALFCSSLTKSQVVAAVAAFAILLVLTFLPWVLSAKASLSSFWRAVTDQGVMARYVDFSKGVLDTGNLVYFLATTAVFLFLTVKVMEARRWK
jgi:ABC-2 type transport system permease protein